MITLATEALRGSYTPLVTPFSHGKIDTHAYEALIEHQIANGTHGLVICGTTGEPSLLTLAERKALLDTAVATSDDRVPVVAATGAQSLVETLELTEHASATGAAAVLVVTPYFIKPPKRGLVDYYAAVCSATDLPVMLYHIPGRAAVAVDVEVLSDIAKRAENFVGIKHAANDLQLVTDAIRALGPEFRVHVGLEELSFPMLAIGAAGMVNAVANVDPQRVAALYNAMRAGKLDEGRRLHFELTELSRSVFLETNPIPLKYMMMRLGLLASNEHRLPMVSATDETGRRCDNVLRSAGLL